MDLKEQLGKILQGAANLTVITSVGDVVLSGTIEDANVTLPPNSKTMVTNMNILTGDITSVFSESFSAEPEGPMVKVHDAMITKANDTIARNVAILRELIEKFGSAL